MRPVALVAAAVLAGTLTACTGSSHHATHVSPVPRPSASPVSTSVNPDALAARIGAAADTVRTAHVTLTAPGQSIHGQGVVVQHDGRLSGLDLSFSGAESLRIIRTRGVTYAKLPSVLTGSTSRPWSVVPAHPGGSTYGFLADAIDSFSSLAAPHTLVAAIARATSAADLGSATVAGTHTTRYRFVVPVTALGHTLPAGASADGQRDLVVQLWADSRDRPVQASTTLAVLGQRLTPVITLTDLDAAVHIAAPPADELQR